MLAASLHNLAVENRFYSLGKHFYKEIQPAGLNNPLLHLFSSDVANLIGLTPEIINSQEFLDVFSGNKLLPNCKPLAHDYAGHQLGNFNPFLGDGRAMLLCDTDTSSGIQEINLKGIGRTPYSRDFDGRASLSDCEREFELSEKLASLDIPTTRSLCVIKGTERTYRQEFLPAAIITRIAPCFIRFGTFENYYFQRNADALKQLADYVIRHFYPEAAEQEKCYAHFFREVVLRTARLIAHWQAKGFVHGMMNTDNQSILGITLDLGEASFNETLDAGYVSSKNDEHGRYAFGEQPVIGLWNCNVLARALSPLIAEHDLRDALSTYESEFLSHFALLRGG